MRAYKCDVCGKYCEDCYEIKDDTFDIFLSDFVDRGQYDKKRWKYEICVLNVM